MQNGSIAVGWLILLLAYFFPAVIAYLRHPPHPHLTPIFIINLLLGWTFVFWVVTLAWAFMTFADNKPTERRG